MCARNFIKSMVRNSRAFLWYKEDGITFLISTHNWQNENFFKTIYSFTLIFDSTRFLSVLILNFFIWLKQQRIFHRKIYDENCLLKFAKKCYKRRFLVINLKIGVCFKQYYGNKFIINIKHTSLPLWIKKKT